LAFPRPDCIWEERPRFDPPASPESVAEFERVAGFPLPDDLRDFFAVNDSVIAISIHNGFWLGGARQLARSAEQGNLPRSVNGERAIPVATDGGGNAFLLTANGRVWRWNHETDAVV